MILQQEAAEDELRQQLQMRKVPRIEDACVEREMQMLDELAAEGTARRVNHFSGRQRLFRFMHMVREEFCMRPHIFQLEFFNRILRAVAKLLVGDEWPAECVALMREFGWDRIQMQCMASAPRRFGKTVILAIVQVALGYCVQCKQSTFSTSQRASNGLREYVLKIIIESNLGSILGNHGQERVTIYTMDNDRRESILMFLPANPDVRIVSVYVNVCLCLCLCMCIPGLQQGTWYVRASIVLLLDQWTLRDWRKPHMRLLCAVQCREINLVRARALGVLSLLVLVWLCIYHCRLHRKL